MQNIRISWVIMFCTCMLITKTINTAKYIPLQNPAPDLDPDLDSSGGHVNSEKKNILTYN